MKIALFSLISLLGLNLLAQPNQTPNQQLMSEASIYCAIQVYCDNSEKTKSDMVVIQTQWGIEDELGFQCYEEPMMTLLTRLRDSGSLTEYTLNLNNARSCLEKFTDPDYTK